MVLPPAGCGDCGSGCAEGRGDAGPGGGCEDAAGLGGDCCCDSSEHGDDIFMYVVGGFEQLRSIECDGQSKCGYAGVGDAGV